MVVSAPPSVHLPSNSLQQVADQIVSTRRITRADQSRLKAIAFRSADLTSEEQRQVDRVFEAWKKGLLRLVD
ncbi:MAG: hypothetical protein HC769_00010 [Cyanobacteria bacterium CRU_2_1]|nr:hypothetical protein [Cyanobacteria bacterium RU_5_0]NJR57366.1 hypothetical protein [Cyanobacteria bacterium CRU_2_1]